MLISPLAIWVALLTGLSIWPLLLVGRFQGDLGKKPLERDVVRAFKRQRERTEQYYQST